MMDSPLELVGVSHASLPLPARPAGEGFSRIFDLAQKSRDRELVRDAATKLVASAFIMPVLATMHDSEFLEPPFAPSTAQKRFQPLLDQHLADRIAQGANFSIVDVIVDRLMGPEPEGGKP